MTPPPENAARCPNCRKPIARRGEHYDGGLLADYTCDKERQMANPVTTESPFDYAYFKAHALTLGTLVPGVGYTLVRHNDNSDHGRAECFFADQNDAERYVTRLKAASASGSLDEHFHPWPASMDLALLIFTVTRRG